jgi:hypothetical protein
MVLEYGIICGIIYHIRRLKFRTPPPIIQTWNHGFGISVAVETTFLPSQAQFLTEVARLTERLHRISPDRGSAPSLRYINCHIRLLSFFLAFYSMRDYWWEHAPLLDASAHVCTYVCVNVI